MMSSSNLSKIKPQLRTKGNITGNFGKPKSKSGSPLNDIGVTSSKVVKVTPVDEYINRLYNAFDTTDDPKLKRFIYGEIKKILVKRGEW
jgi:hypothetical protein